VRILLDENLDWRLRRELPGHEVESVPLIGWAGLKNGVARLAAPWDRSQIKPWSRVVWRRIIPWVEAI
jgi:hypothetical protein